MEGSTIWQVQIDRTPALKQEQAHRNQIIVCVANTNSTKIILIFVEFLIMSHALTCLYLFSLQICYLSSWYKRRAKKVSIV